MEWGPLGVAVIPGIYVRAVFEKNTNDFQTTVLRCKV
jgi:hypothetical protein